MSDLEKGLEQIHEAVRKGEQVDLQRFVVQNTDPFVVVDEVAKDSAADKSVRFAFFLRNLMATSLSYLLPSLVSFAVLEI